MPLYIYTYLPILIDLNRR